ncbi:type I-MYXAN CRISPR-associated protein Cas6/Cmx6 [Lyngbya sp. CCY1209]|uniref:type I-MYXAN CRISPR-associated protein Cas6/Cmx6 n=1 Tax=Lyngbya sp. CCY1209 TaxID=2886103 RepID=UPI002D2075AF|nr:type I-MYXAN CRISPR-associated protein Cas6/Cmx6 [Lyngbya sp. CCY1209]MEB3884071.1 type I-MYXAN CRISPR-associated protein Cas6/Cmx6 [Lyngbya sp. CCY1209]
MNYLEIQFQLRGKTLPADHGYSIYSALKQTVLEGKTFPPEVLLCSVPGVGDRDGTIFLNRSSRLRLRCPAEQVQQWYRSLQNAVLDVRGHLVRLVQPRMSLVQPSPLLRSRLVTFKLKEWHSQEAPVHFLESCQRALKSLEIDATVHIESNADGDLALRALQVRHQNILGFGVCVEGLKDEDSIKLQCCGLGGRKHFGCGWFYPVKEC